MYIKKTDEIPLDSFEDEEAPKRKIPWLKISGYFSLGLGCSIILGWLFVPAFRLSALSTIYSVGTTDLKHWSIRNMGELGDDGVLSLSRALQSKDRALKMTALETLRNLGLAARPAAPALARTLVDKDREVRKKSAEVYRNIAESVPAAIPILVKNLADDNYQYVPSVLTRIGKAAVPALIEAVESDQDPDQRLRAIRVLGTLRAEAANAIPALGRLLESDDATTRLNVANALGEIGPASINTLLAVLRDKNSRVSYTDQALLRIGTSAIPAIIGAVREDGNKANSRLMKVFYSLFRRVEGDDSEFRSLLSVALTDKRPFIREKFVFALGILSERSKDARELLILQLDDSDDNVKKTVLKRLGHLGQRAKAAGPAIKQLRNDPALGPAARDALQRIGLE
jgi:HEAT repeat protein